MALSTTQRPKRGDKKLRYGFIGAGGIAGEHLTHLADRRDVEIVALADPNDQMMARHAAKFGVKQTFSDWKEMLAKVQLDAVSICTPNKLHAECAIGAMEAGCAVLCEKPLAGSAEEGEQMIAAAERLGRKLVIGFQYRFNSRTQFLKSAADGGQFGRILYARVQALRRRGIPNWGVFGRKELQGGGPLIDIGVHVLEMCHYTLGSPTPVSASADMFTYIGNKPSDTRSVAVERLGLQDVQRRGPRGRTHPLRKRHRHAHRNLFRRPHREGLLELPADGRKRRRDLGPAAHLPRRRRAHGRQVARVARRRAHRPDVPPQDEQLRRPRSVRHPNARTRPRWADRAEDDRCAVSVGGTGRHRGQGSSRRLRLATGDRCSGPAIVDAPPHAITRRPFHDSTSRLRSRMQ